MASGPRGKRTLPLFDNLIRRDATQRPAEPADDRPTLELARRRLGGKGASDATAGAVVRYLGVDDAPTVGVVVYAAGDEVDVWMEGDRVRRTTRDWIEPAVALTAAQREVSGDARVFAALSEGGRVRVRVEGEASVDAVLVEKCRYGALVARDDGTLMAVGFRKLVPTGGGLA